MKNSELELYLVLKKNEIGPYVDVVTAKGEVVNDIQNWKLNNPDVEINPQLDLIFDYIDKSKSTINLDKWNNDVWSSDDVWGEEESEEISNLTYLTDELELVEMLLKVENFVDENFEKIECIDENVLTLNICEVEDDEAKIKLQSTLLLNEQFSDFILIEDDYALYENKFYKLSVENTSMYELKNLRTSFSPWELEGFLSVFFTRFKNIKLNCFDYAIEKNVKRFLMPELIIEKISQDNSLYMKVTMRASTLSYEFLKENDITEIAVVNTLEKKVQISQIEMKTLNDVLQEIVKSLMKHQKKIKVKGGYFLDEDNLFILQEKLAKEFIGKELLKLANKYKVIGAEKLKKYNIKTVKPRIIGSFKHSVNFLEGSIQLEIEGEKFSLAQILSSYKTDSYIVLSDGTNALINHKYIEKLERIFNAEKNGDSVKVSFFDLPIVEEMIDETIFNGEFTKSSHFFSGINKIDSYDVQLPKINAVLREYQEYGYKWLSYLVDNRLGGCLADDMGLGKTLQAITLLSRIHSEKKNASLVVMPKSLIYNWQAEIEKFNSKLNCGIYYGNNRDTSVIKGKDIILTTYGTIRNDIEKLRHEKFETIILDESQNIKNVNAQTTKAIMLLNSENRLALSGTPIENNLSELYSLFRFLNPAMFGSLENFNNTYANPIQHDNDKEVIHELRKKIYPFILRRVKKEVLKDLPEKIEQTLVIEMNPEQKRYYEERRSFYYNSVKSQISEQGLGKSQFYLLQAINELRQITSCPENKDPKIESSKRKLLINSVSDAVANGHKVLVFANYIATVEGISKELTQFGIKHLTMVGGTKERQSLVNKFQNDVSYKVFVMTLKTGGVGLNLTSADTIFIYDPWWNKTVENQAVDRAYRIGQDKTVFSYKLILKDTIEEKILKLQGMKSEMLDNLISEDNTSAKFLTEEDIKFILGDE